MKVINWLFDDVKEEEPQMRFMPKIQVSSSSTLHVEVEPKDPTSTSNIVITAFASRQVRTIVPIRVEWSKFKVKSDNTNTKQKVYGLVGNTYMCEPSDVGSFVKAVVTSTDFSVKAFAEAIVGPIGIDVMMKRLIEGALHADKLISQIKIAQKDQKKDVTMRLTSRTVQFTTDDAYQNYLCKSYTLSEPKIELNPKDPTRVYLRFEQDQENEVKQWLDTVMGPEKSRRSYSRTINESQRSIRVPHNTHSSSSSKMKLFQKEQGHCINKMELRFISRHSRDLFLFAQRAFICKQDMKSSIYVQRIETLTNISTEADYMKFLEFSTLRHEILRIAGHANEIEEDRNQKVKDLVQMEESIGQMTMTYLKIIEEKGRMSQADFQNSYSQISMARQEIIGRKNFRQLKQQNQNLKNRLRQMNEQIELLKFFKKDDNQSMILNHTSNPFLKAKQNESNTESMFLKPQEKPRKAVYEMSIGYMNLLEENQMLKTKLNKDNNMDRSQGMLELLGSLSQKEDKQMKNDSQKELELYKHQNYELKSKVMELENKIKLFDQQGKARSSRNLEKSVAYEQLNFSRQSNSLVNKSNNSSLNQSSMLLNQSCTSQAAIGMLEDKLNQLTRINTNLFEENDRLRKERNHFRSQCQKLSSAFKDKNDHHVNDSLSNSQMGIRREEFENLQNQKNYLQKKLDSLAKEKGGLQKEQFMQKQKRIVDLCLENEKLIEENIKLKKSLENAKNYSTMVSNDTSSNTFYQQENKKLKQINTEILEELKTLRMELQMRGQSQLGNSRVLQLEKELQFIKESDNIVFSGQNKQLMAQIAQLSKTNSRLKRENQDKLAKLNSQTLLIERLMENQIQQKSQQKVIQSPGHKSLKRSTHSQSSTANKEKSYSQRPNHNTIEEVEKLKKKIKELQQEIVFMRRSTDALNRSRDLTMDMEGYYEQKVQILKKEVESLYHNNETLSQMCQKYNKEARQANKELKVWKQKALNAMRFKGEDSSLMSSQLY